MRKQLISVAQAIQFCKTSSSKGGLTPKPPLAYALAPKCSFFKVARWFDFTNFITEKKNHSNMLCYTQKWVIYWYFKFWIFTLWNLSPEISVEWHWIKFVLTLREKQSFSFWHWENERKLLTMCVLKNFYFLLGAKTSSLTCDLSSLSLLSNRADSLVTSVSSKVRKCAEPPEYLRNEILFLRTCNIPNLISYIHRIALSKCFTGYASTWLWNCMRTKTNIFSMENFLTRTLLVTNFTNLCRHILINETNVKYEATTLYQFEILLFI